MKLQSEKTGAKSMTRQLLKQSKNLISKTSRRDLYHVTYLGMIASTDIQWRLRHDIDTPINHWEMSAFWSYRTSTEYVKAIDDFTDDVRSKRPKPGIIGMELVLQRIRYHLNIETFNPIEDDEDSEDGSFKVNVNHRGTFSRLKNREWNVPYFPTKPSEHEEMFNKLQAIDVAKKQIGMMVDLLNTDSKDWGKDDAERRKLQREYPKVWTHPYTKNKERFLEKRIVEALYHLVDFTNRSSIHHAFFRSLSFNMDLVLERYLPEAERLYTSLPTGIASGDKKILDKIAIIIQNISTLAEIDDDVLLDAISQSATG